MRSAVAACLLIAVLPVLARAQPGPYIATVSVAEARLRAGPSDKYPETGTIAIGAKVVVHDETNGWLMVQAPGAVSWVPTQFIDYDKDKKLPQNVATQEDVTLAPGRVGLPQPLAEVRLAKVPAGTVLTVIGTAEKFDNKTWYPVEPPFGDFRYIPKAAVQGGSAVNTSFVVRDTAPAGAAVVPAAGPRTDGAAGLPASKPTVNHPLWSQAEAAERDGRYEEAEKLFFQLARTMNEPGGEHEIANLCYTRIHMLREKKRNVAEANLPPAATATGPQALQPGTGSPTRSAPSAREERATLLPPVRPGEGSSATPAPATAQPGEDRPRWSGPGMLVRAVPVVDGRQTYALESAPGVVRMYVVAGTGMDLKAYENRKVELFGISSTRKDLNKPIVVATQVEANP